MARTPGPWTFDPIAMNLIRGADGFAVATTSVATSNTENLYPTQRANARLIAAAPDLLDAVRVLTEYVESRGHGAGLVRLARAAIAKAEGR